VIDSSVRSLVAGDLEAVFLPRHGMLGASLRHCGAEILRRVDDLDAAAARGSTAGIPLLHPWANRLDRPCYHVAGREVALDLSSPLLHLDENSLPMHGVPWSLLTWEVIEATRDRLVARLEWGRSDLFAIFPFSHRLEMVATLRTTHLTMETTLVAGPDGAVPVSFGFHPYFGLPDLAREKWRLELPAMQKLRLDQHGIPTGEENSFDGFDGSLNESSFDDGFALLGEAASFSISGAGRRIKVELLAGYRYAQVFAPKHENYIALEPMTAPTSALTSGRGLLFVGPGETFRAAFRIRVDVLSRDSARLETLE
jgi:aldose 1-epimerase